MCCYGSVVVMLEPKLVMGLGELLVAKVSGLSAWIKRPCVKCLVSLASVTY